MLETPARLVGRRVAAAAPGLAQQAGAGRRDRLVEGVPGLGERTSKKGGERVGKNPTDRAKPGSKHHVVSDRKGVPLAVALAVALTAANVHDSKLFEDLRVVDAIEPIRRPAGKPGRLRKRPEKLHADKGYDFPRCRGALRRRGIKGRIARRGVDSSEKLGRHRWVVERTPAWLSRYRRLSVRYERRADIHEAFLHLGCSLICLNYLT